MNFSFGVVTAGDKNPREKLEKDEIVKKIDELVEKWKLSTILNPKS